MKQVKPFLTIDEQIKLLKERGLIINNNQYDIAKEFLLNNNYYRISGYSLTLRNNDSFYKTASLDTLMQIYEADRRMRHIMLSITEIVENRMKSLIAYYHSKEYGPLGYLDVNNFYCKKSGNKINLLNVDNYLYITRKANNQKNRISETELFLKHHKENKDNVFPFWVYIEVLTVSDVSKLYTILDKNIRENIALDLGFTSNKGYSIVENLLHCITILRNICAHGGRLYNRLFTRKPWLSKKEKSLLRVENNNKILDKLFSYILILKSITLSQDFNLVIEHINLIYEQYPLVNFKYYGFPDNWKDVL